MGSHHKLPEHQSFSINCSVDTLLCESFSFLDENSCNRYKENDIKIRRLSTKSSVMGIEEDVIALTQWKWYWSKGESEWTEYTTWVLIVVYYFILNRLHISKNSICAGEY